MIGQVSGRTFWAWTRSLIIPRRTGNRFGCSRLGWFDGDRANSRTSCVGLEFPSTVSNVASRNIGKKGSEASSSRTRRGTLYVDGHVRLYHGKQTELPRRYVSRQRLCLRGTTDYWANDALGLPFFSVERPIDHGMLEALRSDVVPHRPSPAELEANPHRCRLLIIFDREGYSPAFFKEMWQTHLIACITYHKYPKRDLARRRVLGHESHAAHRWSR